MSNDQPARRPPAKASGGGAPMGSTISIVIAVVAVVVGFLILRNINDDSGADSSGLNPGVSVPSDQSTPANSDETTTTTGPIITTTTTLPLNFDATVVVANASGVPGAAGQMSDALTTAGFKTEKATNAVGVEQRLDVSKVYYMPGADLTAQSVARVMGNIQIATMPSTVPVEGEATGLGTATVLLMLGKDYGGKALPALSADGSSTTIAIAPLTETTTSTTIAG